MRLLCVIVAAICLTALAGQAALGQSTAPSSFPAEPQIARWDVILNDAGMDAIKQMELPAVQTPSTGYQAYVCDGAALRGTIVQAAATGGLEQYSQLMTISPSDRTAPRAQIMFMYNPSAKSSISGRGDGEGSLAYHLSGDGRVHLKVNFPKITVGFSAAGQAMTLAAPAAVVFDTDLNAGDAMLFVADYTAPSKLVYHHIFVWEIFNAKSWEINYFNRLHDSAWWCQNGPETLRAWADAALVWAAGAKHSANEAPPEFEQKLDDGKVARLKGATRIDAWPFCWWDGRGEPVYIQEQMYFATQSKKQWCDVELVGAPEQTSAITPVPREGDAPNAATLPRYDTWTFTNATSSGDITFGVSVGPWTQVGSLELDHSIAVGNKTYLLSSMQTEPNLMILRFSCGTDTDNGDMLALTAVGKDGREINQNGIRELTAKNYNLSPIFFQGMNPSDVKTFHVWQRKRQLVTFRHIPYQPSPPPPTQVTPGQLAAAEAKLFPPQKPIPQASPSTGPSGGPSTQPATIFIR